MLFFLNTYIKKNQNIYISLSKIFGINLFLSKKICTKLNISLNVKFNLINNIQIEKISMLINENFCFGNNLKNLNLKQKNRLIKISSYRGLRLKQGLPVRGQRTHTNSKNAKKLNNF